MTKADQSENQLMAKSPDTIAAMAKVNTQLVALIMLTGLAAITSCSSKDSAQRRPALQSAFSLQASERKQREVQWKAQVAKDQRARVALLDSGAAPRRLLGPAMQPGEKLAADLELVTDIEIWRDGDSQRFARHQVVHAHVELVARADEGEETSIAFTLSNLGGDIKHAEQLGKNGVITAGLYGEPWSCAVLPNIDAQLEDVEVVAWEHQVKEWLRQVLVPLPDVPVGVGARWTVRADDWLASEQIHSTYAYTLAAFDRDQATIEQVINTQSSAGSSQGTASFVIVAGVRAVPTGKLSIDGTAIIADGHATHMHTTGTLAVRPSP